MAAGNGRNGIERLEWFLRENVAGRLELGLLCFWSKHCHTRFSRDAILDSMNSTKRDIQQALDAMAARGLLQMEIANGVALYSLAADYERRSLVQELGYRASDMQEVPLHDTSSLVAGYADHTLDERVALVAR